MKRLGVIAAVCLLPQLAFAWPWSTDMMNQPSIKPQEPGITADNKPAMFPFPAQSIPVGGIPTKVANREEAKGLTSPIAATPDSIKKGRNLFRIYCAACHGLQGNAESPVASKIGAISLTDGYVDTLTDGWVWGTITFGSFIMPAYGAPSSNAEHRGSNDLSVEERWHVVNYVRHGLKTEPAVKTAATK